MPFYEYRCNTCEQAVTLFYKSYGDYDQATPTCPHCHSENLTRLISQVAIKRPTALHNYKDMSSQQMLSVMESGDSQAMGELFKQVGETVPDAVDRSYNEVTERLLKGDSPSKIDSDLKASAVKLDKTAPKPKGKA